MHKPQSGLGYTLIQLSTIKVIIEHRSVGEVVKSLTLHNKNLGSGLACRRVWKRSSLVFRNTVKQLSAALWFYCTRSRILIVEFLTLTKSSLLIGNSFYSMISINDIYCIPKTREKLLCFCVTRKNWHCYHSSDWISQLFSKWKWKDEFKSPNVSTMHKATNIMSANWLIHHIRESTPLNSNKHHVIDILVWFTS